MPLEGPVGTEDDGPVGTDGETGGGRLIGSTALVGLAGNSLLGRLGAAPQPAVSGRA